MTEPEPEIPPNLVPPPGNEGYLAPEQAHFEHRKPQYPVDPTLPPLEPIELIKPVDLVKYEASESKVTISEAVTSILIASFICWNYLYGLITASRRSLYWELMITIAFPLFIEFAGWLRWGNTRLKQLIMIESIYNVITILAKIAIEYDYPSLNQACNWLYIPFFFMQASGFLYNQFDRKLYFGFLQSLLMVVSIANARYVMRDVDINVIDQEGRFLMWGREVPVMLRAQYVVWYSNVVFVDYEKFLPKLTLAVAQSMSVAISWFSGEFFHIRLMTACHLFILDALVNFTTSDVVWADFCAMPTDLLSPWRKYFVPFVKYTSTILSIIITIMGLACGPDEAFCVA